MKTLFIGGIKSGKSRLAEVYMLEQAGSVKPYYLATTEFIDEEMRLRIDAHQQRRHDTFITLEEPVQLYAALQKCDRPVLIECISMWLNNLLYRQVPESAILEELAALMQLPVELVLVHNEVGSGVIGENERVRQYVDLSGKAAQLMGRYCERVYFCSAGLKLQMK